MIPPEDRWEPWPIHAEITGGPERIYDDNPTADRPRPVEFKPPAPDTEPLLWEGDNA